MIFLIDLKLGVEPAPSGILHIVEANTDVFACQNAFFMETSSLLGILSHHANEAR